MAPALLITLPRFQFSYAFYCVAPLILFRFNFEKYAASFLLVGYFFLLFLINFFLNSVSIAAFFLEVALIFPLFYMVLGGEFNKEKVFRLCGILAMGFSIVNMTKVGFPFLLPYRDFLPDYFSGFYGRGGAKLVTIIGYFSLISELNRAKDKSILWIAISLINFVTPNYILGIVCGVAALCAARLKLKVLILMSLLGILLLPYIIYRFENLDNTMMNVFGYHPKLLAYISLVELWVEYPKTIFVGTGLGQFSSYPALWSSEYIKVLSTHEIPDIPYLFMSEYHDTMLGKYLEVGIDNFWAISSSANKPYVSWVTLVAEMGVPSFLGVIWLLWKRYSVLSSVEKHMVKPAFLFSILAFGLDVWHDSPIFIFCFIALFGESLRERRV